VSVVALDPNADGEAARVARWNFAPDEIATHFRESPEGHGLQFELPWPAAPPKGRDLQLFVRFTSAEGRKITADTKIDVRSPPAGNVASQRQPKSWSASARAERGSRDPDRTSDAAEDRSGDVANSRRDDRRPIRQASAPGRPVWKPYR
jgi:hypothetical protein